MKTFDECKGIVAQKWGYNSWDEIDWYQLDYTNDMPLNGKYGEEILLLEAVELYANKKAELAHDMACYIQLEMVSNTFRENQHKGDRQSDNDVFEAIADTIRKHPQPENPYENA